MKTYTGKSLLRHRIDLIIHSIKFTQVGGPLCSVVSLPFVYTSTRLTLLANIYSIHWTVYSLRSRISTLFTGLFIHSAREYLLYSLDYSRYYLHPVPCATLTHIRLCSANQITAKEQENNMNSHSQRTKTSGPQWLLLSVSHCLWVAV